jgi:hypothetical protein
MNWLLVFFLGASCVIATCVVYLMLGALENLIGGAPRGRGCWRDNGETPEIR